MHRIGIDVGGTFTDLIAFDDNSGTLTSIKVSTTPQDPSQSIADTLRRFLMGTAGPVGLIVHASTIGSNLFFGQMRLHLPKAALLTTEGFRDVLEIGRQRRAELYNLFYRRPAPLIRRRYRYGIRERIDATGAVQVPLDEAQLTAVAEDLRREGVEVIAVCYLHSYANPVHEERTAAALAERLGAPALVLSSRVDPHYREYERTSTTVLNALLMPVVSRYLDRLHRTMHDLGISAPLYVMQSSGGMMTLASASALPAAVIESGPAAGVVGAAYLGRDLGLGDVLSFDMGGTTAKAGAVIGGAAQVVNEYEIAGKVHAGRIVKGSGYPVRFPFIDLAEVSAGGGTVAWVEGGGLRVGPISAGADPGPAAYGRGGTDLTVTDCNLLLGRLSARGLLDGQMPLSLGEASEAVARVARQVAMDPIATANGVLRIIHTQMVRALRLVSLERGYDPRSLALIAFGGGGPMHATFLAEELGMAQVIIPPAPGLFSALGLLVADLRRDGVRAILRDAVETLQPVVDRTFHALANELLRALAKDGFPSADVVIERQLEMRYKGQSYELAVTGDRVSEGIEAFHERHQRVYGYMAREEPVEVVTARAVAYVSLPKPAIAAPAPAGMSSSESGETRRAYFDGWHQTPVYRRNGLRPGHVLQGPAIVEQYDTTTIVPPNWRLFVEATGVLRLWREHFGR